MSSPTTLTAGDRIYSEWRGQRHEGTVRHVDEWEDDAAAEYPDTDPEPYEQLVIVDYDYGEQVQAYASRFTRL